MLVLEEQAVLAAAAAVVAALLPFQIFRHLVKVVKVDLVEETGELARSIKSLSNFKILLKMAAAAAELDLGERSSSDLGYAYNQRFCLIQWKFSFRRYGRGYSGR